MERLTENNTNIIFKLNTTIQKEINTAIINLKQDMDHQTNSLSKKNE